MLARANRITRGAEYKCTVRRGRRVVGANSVCYFRRSEDASVSRFGFIVGKSVGIAVKRNLVRRRLKAICRSLLSQLPSGMDVVIRALPASAEASWATLQEEIFQAMNTGARRTQPISKGGAS